VLGVVETVDVAPPAAPLELPDPAELESAIVGLSAAAAAVAVAGVGETVDVAPPAAPLALPEPAELAREAAALRATPDPIATPALADAELLTCTIASYAVPVAFAVSAGA
jgi:hypothetical protein